MKLWFTVICLAVLCSTVSAELVAQYKTEELPEHGVPQPPKPHEEKPHRKWVTVQRDGKEQPPHHYEEKLHHERFCHQRKGEEQEQQKGVSRCLSHHHHRRGAVTHCQSDFESLCGEQYESGQFKELWQCMIENVDRISNGTCKEWVKGKQACKNAATSLCGNQVIHRHEIRRCLRSLDPTTIPEDCRDSRFYNHTVRSHHKYVPRTIYIRHH
ncbi:hypothetical protein LSM04_003954 [Trypanosoma melophagium]|uniref:uncharacterized protein n=1 Tax=Trypanosoma melophagium TaxID=715481 RepID=UPI00351A745F|nr:hypothetical protein LSM04_003954 [Trypanosoma melophagium]